MPNVVDIRNIGLIAAIELASRPGEPLGSRALDAHIRAFGKGAYIRVAGEVIALAPPLIIEKAQIDELFQIVRDVLSELA
jgi:beta-alanine--pyruvate transaminase